MSEEENEWEQKVLEHGRLEHADTPRADESFKTDLETEEPVSHEGEQEQVLSEFELNEVIESLCLSKAEEFKLIGYEHVSGKEVWDCVSDRYRKLGIPALHQIVNDILSLKSTQFMNWMTMSAYKGARF
jgi:hypothetical protein